MPSEIGPTYAVDGMTPARVERPSTVEELSNVLRDASEAGESVIPWGAGTRMHIGNLPERYDVAIDVRGLDRVVEHEPGDLTVVAEAGVTIADLQAHLAPSGQRLAYDPASPERATIGGSLASNAVGPLRTGFGGIRDLTIGMKVVEADGAVTKSGGRVVKNVQGFDLVRLHIGAFGTLGVIAEAAFKLTPLPAHVQTVAAWFDSLDWAREASMQLYNGRFMPEALTLSTGTAARGFAREAGAGDEPPELYLLLARLAGGPAAVRRQVDDVTSTVGASMANGFEVLVDDEADRAWGLVDDSLAPAVSARSTLKTTAAFDFVSRLERGEPEVGLSLETTIHAGTGTVLASWSAGEPTIEQVMQAVELSVSSARACGGRATIERCPVEAKQQIDVWNEDSPALEIMRRLKEQFDPGRTLSPGRFVGRI